MKKYNIKRIPLDKSRKEYIEGAIRNIRENKPISGFKNLMQSFVYLILNDDFNRAVLSVRYKLNIPKSGFASKRDFNAWKNKENFNKLYEKSGKIIEKFQLCFEKHKPIITELIKCYLLLDEFNPKSYMSLTNKKFNYDEFIGGFDVPDPEIGKENTKNFDKISWEICIQPTDNITEAKRSLKKYFVWMMKYHFNNYFKSPLFKIANKDVLKKINFRVKRLAELKVVKKKNKIDLRFISYSNTKTKEIERLFERNKRNITEIQNSISQKDYSATTFRDKVRHYMMYLENFSAKEIEKKLYNKNVKSSYSKKSDLIRTQVKETKKNVALAIQRKLTL